MIFFRTPPPAPGVPPEKKAVHRYQEFFSTPPPPWVGGALRAMWMGQAAVQKCGALQIPSLRVSHLIMGCDPPIPDCR